MKNDAGALHGLAEMKLNGTLFFKGEFVNGDMVGGLCRFTNTEDGMVITGKRKNGLFYGICRYKFPDAAGPDTIYYGEVKD